jgi:5-methylcytosine-specific restriction endonuclease McrA
MPARQDDCSKCGAPKERTAAGRLTCRPCEAAYHRARRTEDPEANRVRCREYAAAHREEAKQRALEWHYANQARANARSTATYWSDRESGQEKRRADYRNKPDEYKERARRRAARQRDALCQHESRCVTSDFLRTLYASPCLYCGEPAEHADHFQPIHRGGLHCRDNLVPACQVCNRSKGSSDPIEWLAKRQLLT